MIELRDMFRSMIDAGASDLHIVVGAPPQIRVRGELHTIEGYEDLSPEDSRELIFGILSNEQRQRLEVQWEIDFSYSVPGMARWRVNAFYQRGAVGAAFRIIPEEIKPLSELGVPDSVYELAKLPRGLVLVTGPTGSGKSTTLAGIIDVINEQRSDHILTVEDPIEFIHKHKNCIINQREVGQDTDGFARALKSALRQDPDVILVGEMRDLETIQTALTAAETGHLVFGTLHTSSAAKTVDRVIDVFPPHQQEQVRVQLASSLQGVVTQTLIPTRDGQGRVVACEVMIPNNAIRNLIREGKIFQIPSVMQTSQGEGMQTLDAALATLVRSNQITHDEAIKRSHEPEEFKRLYENGGGAPVAGKMVIQRPETLRLMRRSGAMPLEYENEWQEQESDYSAVSDPHQQAPAYPAQEYGTTGLPAQEYGSPGLPAQAPQPTELGAFNIDPAQPVQQYSDQTTGQVEQWPQSPAPMPPSGGVPNSGVAGYPDMQVPQPHQPQPDIPAMPTPPSPYGTIPTGDAPGYPAPPAPGVDPTTGLPWPNQGEVA